MRRCLEQVAAFNRMVGAPKGAVAKPDATVDMELRVRLIAEEFDELLCALSPETPAPSIRMAVEEWLGQRREWTESREWIEVPPPTGPHLPGVADALADLAFVTIGANDVWGIPGDAVWEEVCRANMAKLGGPKDPKTGKALKPAGWTPPDIEGVLKRSAAYAEAMKRTRRCGQCGKDVPEPEVWGHPDYCYGRDE